MDYTTFSSERREGKSKYSHALERYKNISTTEEADQLFASEVEKFISKVVELTQPYDAFDLVELMKMRELNPFSGASSLGEGSAFNIELIAAVLIARSDRALTSEGGIEVPGEVIEELHGLASSLTAHLVWTEFHKEELQENASKEDFALYQTSRAVISNYQFDEIRDKHDGLLLDNDLSKSLMEKHFGYGLAEVKAIRDAISQIQNTRFTRLRDKSSLPILEIIQREGDVKKGTEEENRVIKEALVEMLFKPASRAVMTSEDLAVESELPSSVVERILSDFSLSFDPSITARDRVKGLLNGDWLFTYKPLIRAESGEFISVANGIGDDVIRRMFEERLKQHPKEHQKYDQQVRAKITESLTTQYLERILKSDSRFPGLEYVWSTKKSEDTKLDSSFIFDSSTNELAECDVLFIRDDVALIVEVKGKSISDRARKGHRARFVRDLKDTIENARTQALRLSSLIYDNRGIWQRNGKWLDLAGVTRVYNVVVLLDDVGPVSVQASGKIQDRQVGCWIVTLHDLAVISRVLNRPEVFLAYVQCRATQGQQFSFVAVDELDVFTKFLNGDLFVAAKTAPFYRRVPLVEPTNGAIDAWITRNQDQPYLSSALRPTLEIGPSARRIIAQVRAGESAGYLSVCTDLSLIAISAPDVIEEWLQEVLAWKCSEDAFEEFLIEVERGETDICILKFGGKIKYFNLVMEIKGRKESGNRERIYLFMTVDNFIRGFLRK